ncbi:MAG: hypothetical protein WC044_00360 [Crocinitomicaceae bacterium]
MKRIVFAFVLLLSMTISAQKPEKVYSFAKEARELSWYKVQHDIWKSETTKNPKNGEAWINYYRATRALRHMAPNESDEWNQALFDKYQLECKEIAQNVAKALPKSFESYVLAGAEQSLMESADNWLKAAEIRPFDPEILDELMIYYDLQLDEKNKGIYAKKMFETNQMAVGQLNWAYNILAELDENAVLFTLGDNDTYATWIVQEAKQFRKDVTVVNMFLIQDDNYRNKLFKKLGYSPLELKLKDAQTDEDMEAGKSKIYNHFFKGERPVYFVNSTNDYMKTIEDKLYLTGLAQKYSETSFDNLAIIKRNFEKRYLLDYLTEVFSTNISDEIGKRFNGMYLPAMIKLYQHFEESEDELRKKELEIQMLRVAEQTGKSEEVNKLLGRK